MSRLTAAAGVQLVLSLLANNAEGVAPVEVLQPVASWVIEPPGDDASARLDPSGIHVEGAVITVVSDKEDFPDLYRLVDSGAYLRAEPALTLPTTKATDFEGLARCGGDWFLAVEDGSYVLRVSVQQAAVLLTPIFLDLRSLPEGLSRRWGNTGLEGVACTEDGRLFVAKERDPRWLFEVDPHAGSLTPIWDGKWALEGAGLPEGVDPDFSDLHYADGFLYVLERGRRAIVKLDVSEEGAARAVDWRPFSLVESELYDYRDPYGMAEGLFVAEDVIWILLDNNGDSLKADPAGRPQAMLLCYPRPVGF